MIIYQNDCTDPYFNLAAEQYLLDTGTEPVFMLWRNDSSVIIGKNQNAYAEINQAFTEEHHIKVVRRLTGGGAVFHDLGNLNYTYIIPAQDGKALDFARFCGPMVDALRRLGLNAELSGRNDITVDGKKVSGTAECVYNGKIMHHGTLLFSADMSRLSGALHVDSEKIRSKGIGSVRARVANLSEYLPGMDVLAFRDYLESAAEGERLPFSAEQIAGISHLRDTKYATWEWNFGVSRQFEKRCRQRFPFGTLDVIYNSDRGRITEIRFFGDFFGVDDTAELEKSLVGCPLTVQALTGHLTGVDRYIMGADVGTVVSLLLR